MSDRLPVGPYRTLSFEGGEIPYYIVPFDKRGVCQAPKTREHLVANLAEGGFSDVFFFSHGWNNDWTVATERYESFIEGFMQQRTELGLPVPDGYKPLLVGIFWPSTLLVFGEDEKGPRFQSAGGRGAGLQSAGDREAAEAEVDERIASERLEVAEIAAELSAEDAEDFYRLAQLESLNEAQARRLAEILVTVLPEEDGELGVSTSMTADELLEVWKADGDGTGKVDDGGLSDVIAGGVVAPAGISDVFKKLDPRKLIRPFSVYQMKDRAGRVGSTGVARLLRDILAGSGARVHLIGHSFGGKVVLSAAAAGDLPRPVRSMLLLQPAVSHLCFAERVRGLDGPAGYHGVPARIEGPIFTTFSRHDVPLTQLFHLGVRRESDLGENKIAAAAGNPPSRFAALGGFGPRDAGEITLDILDPGQPYDLPDGEIYALRGDRTISGHSDISNPSTWWALHSLLARN